MGHCRSCIWSTLLWRSWASLIFEVRCREEHLLLFTGRKWGTKSKGAKWTCKALVGRWIQPGLDHTAEIHTMFEIRPENFNFVYSWGCLRCFSSVLKPEEPEPSWAGHSCQAWRCCSRLSSAWTAALSPCATQVIPHLWSVADAPTRYSADRPH